MQDSPFCFWGQQRLTSSRGDAAHAPVPVICLVLLLVSYFLRPQVRGSAR